MIMRKYSIRVVFSVLIAGIVYWVGTYFLLNQSNPAARKLGVLLSPITVFGLMAFAILALAVFLMLSMLHRRSA
jgi:small neutral amino acid transporter SnatA (MarC family)